MFRLVILLSFVVFTQAHAQNLKLYVTLNPAGDFVAESDSVSGQAIENPDGSVEATMIKVPVKTLKSGISLRDDHMAEKYLEASKYPDIVLKIAKGKDGKGIGILIVKGKEGKIAGNYATKKDQLKAAFKMKISDFGITDISYKGVGVEDEVKVEVLVPLVKKAAAPAAPAAKPAAKAAAKPAVAPAVKTTTKTTTTTTIKEPAPKK
ncbi:MAG: hypothetical protein K0R29_2159 [Pseudobdellovibrio sp.]|jgi:polyisoprenoid-binding protein YceI|nr:hypothetical protein [Pseudobdellovibrio sp.]